MTEPTRDDPTTLFDLLDQLRNEVDHAFSEARHQGYVSAARIETLMGAARAVDHAASDLLLRRGILRNEQ